MFEKSPSLIPSFLLGSILVLALTAYSLDMGLLSLISYYSIFMLVFLLAIAAISYLVRAVSFAKAMLDLSNPRVQIAKHHAEISTAITRYDTEKIAHHIRILNTLEFPFTIGPDEFLTTTDGKRISGRALTEYIEGMEPDGTTDENGDPVYIMTPERSANRNQRGTFRAVADDMGNDRRFSVSASSNRSPVRTTRGRLFEYLQEIIVSKGKISV